MAISAFLSRITSRFVAFRRSARHRGYQRPVLGYRELTDIGMYRGHVDRIAAAERDFT